MPRPYSEKKTLIYDVNRSDFLARSTESWIGECVSAAQVSWMMGANRYGDIQVMYMPTKVEENNVFKGFIGNASNMSNELALVFTQALDFGYAHVIEEYSKLPVEIRPSQSLKKEYVKDTIWEKATSPLGMALIPLRRRGETTSSSPMVV